MDRKRVSFRRMRQGWRCGWVAGFLVCAIGGCEAPPRADSEPRRQGKLDVTPPQPIEGPVDSRSAGTNTRPPPPQSSAENTDGRAPSSANQQQGGGGSSNGGAGGSSGKDASANSGGAGSPAGAGAPTGSGAGNQGGQSKSGGKPTDGGAAGNPAHVGTGPQRQSVPSPGPGGQNPAQERPAGQPRNNAPTGGNGEARETESKKPDERTVNAPTRDVTTERAPSDAKNNSGKTVEGEGRGYTEGGAPPAATQPTALNPQNNAQRNDLIKERVSPARRAALERYHENLRQMEQTPASQPAGAPASQPSAPTTSEAKRP